MLRSVAPIAATLNFTKQKNPIVRLTGFQPRTSIRPHLAMQSSQVNSSQSLTGQL